MSDHDLQALARAAATGGEQALRDYVRALERAGQEIELLQALARAAPSAPDLRAQLRRLARRLDPAPPADLKLAWARRVDRSPIPFTLHTDPLTLLLHPNYWSDEPITDLGAPVLDLATGERRWTLNALAEPIGDLLIAHQGAELTAHGRDDGEERFRFELEAPCALVPAGDHLLAVRNSGGWLIDLTDSPRTVRTVGDPTQESLFSWTAQRVGSTLVIHDGEQRTVCGEQLVSGEALWRQECPGIGLLKAAGPDDVILSLSTQSLVDRTVSLDVHTGAIRWDLGGICRGVAREQVLFDHDDGRLRVHRRSDGLELRTLEHQPRGQPSNLPHLTPNGLCAMLDAERAATVVDVATGAVLIREPLPEVVRPDEFVELRLVHGAVVGTSSPEHRDPTDMGAAFCWRA